MVLPYEIIEYKNGVRKPEKHVFNLREDGRIIRN